MMNRLDRIFDVLEIDQASLEVRFRRGLLTASLRHLQERCQCFGITPLFLQLLALLVERVVGLGGQSQTVPSAATRAEEARDQREQNGEWLTDSHLTEKGIERAIVRRKFHTLLLRLKQ